jgi:Periplasmic binding protein-like domain
VVGFDDLPMSAWVSPPLTTIVQPLAQMAAMATRTVLALLDGRSDGSSNRIELTTSLVVQASTVPPRGKAETRRQARSQVSPGDGHRSAHSARVDPVTGASGRAGRSRSAWPAAPSGIPGSQRPGFMAMSRSSEPDAVTTGSQRQRVDLERAELMIELRLAGLLAVFAEPAGEFAGAADRAQPAFGLLPYRGGGDNEQAIPCPQRGGG